MRIPYDSVWFVVQVRSSDNEDEIVVGNLGDLLSWAGQFGVQDIRGAFTKKLEAKRFAKKQRIR